MRCPNCGFENANNVQICSRCNQSFAIYEEQIPTYPPRAGWKKKFRKLSYPLGRSHEPRIKDEKQQEKKRFDGKIPIAVFFSLVPGLGHLFYGQRRRGLIFFSVYLISLFFYILFLGTGIGSFFLCIFISSIGSALMDIFRLEKISFTFKQSFWVSIVIAIIVIVVYSFVREGIIRAIDIEPIRVNANYMAPAIQRGDLLLVNRRDYINKEPNRGDLVQFSLRERRDIELGEGRELRYIERIIGLPGERVNFKDREFFINGKRLDKEFCPLARVVEIRENIDITVPPQSYYIYTPYYGENDRYIGNFAGCINRENISGRVFMLYQPISRRQRF